MKKDGFTLIEILISITLVSIVLVSMLSTLVKLKDVYALSNNDTEVRVFGAVISRTINNDIIKNGGIDILEVCDTKGSESIYESSCRFSLNNGSTRDLKLRVVEEETLSENENHTRYIVSIVRSTLEYYDPEEDEILMIKTIYSKETYSVEEDDEKGTVTETLYYHFNGLRSETKSYEHALSGYNKLKLITIKASDPEFNIMIYSGGTYSS